MSELEELAAKAVRDRADDESARAAEAEKLAQRKVAYRDYLFARAVSGDNRVVMMTGLGVLIVGGGIAFGLAPGLWPLWAGAGIAIAALTFFAMAATRRAGARAFERWLAGIPFELDRELYRSALSIEKNDTVVEIRVRFAKPVAENARSLIANAVSGAMGATEARFDGNELAITSPRIECHFIGEENDYYDNRKLHQWMRRCIDRALVVVHATYPIRAIELEIR